MMDELGDAWDMTDLLQWGTTLGHCICLVRHWAPAARDDMPCRLATPASCVHTVVPAAHKLYFAFRVAHLRPSQPSQRALGRPLMCCPQACWHAGRRCRRLPASVAPRGLAVQPAW